jgi:hypothetical protein
MDLKILPYSLKREGRGEERRGNGYVLQVCGIGTTHVTEPGGFHAMSVRVFLIKSAKIRYIKHKICSSFSKCLKLRYMPLPGSAMSQTDAWKWHFSVATQRNIGISV